MQEFLQQFSRNIGDVTLNILAALAVLVGGWLLATIVALILKKIIESTKLDAKLQKLTGSEKSNIKAATIISKVIFYILIIFTLIAFFRVLGLSTVTEPLTVLLNNVFAFLPNLVAALLLVILAWIIATAIHFLIKTVLGSKRFDIHLSEKIGAQGEQPVKFSESLANVAYWVVFLLFLPAILHALKLEGVLTPVIKMLEKFLGFLPNAFGAFIIILFGWFLAKIVRQIVESILSNIGSEQLAERVGMGQFLGTTKLSTLLATIVYTMILISVVIAGLNSLKLDTISGPATHMLSMILNALPSLFAAGIILAVTFFVARLAGNLTQNILTGIGFNRLFVKLGLSKESAKDDEKNNPSSVAGTLVIIALMLIAGLESANILGFGQFALLIKRFLQFSGNILLGVAIFAIGLYLGNLVKQLILSASVKQANLLAQLAKYSIIVLALAMGLGEMGIAKNIVNMSFAIVFGAISLALAISFGIGCKDIAARELDGFISRLRKRD